MDKTDDRAHTARPTRTWDEGRRACTLHNEARRRNTTDMPHWEREHVGSMGLDRVQAPAFEAGYDERMREQEAEGTLV